MEIAGNEIIQNSVFVTIEMIERSVVQTPKPLHSTVCFDLVCAIFSPLSAIILCGIMMPLLSRLTVVQKANRKHMKQ